MGTLPAPLFAASSYEVVPFEGGTTTDLTQITFYGVEQVETPSAPPRYVVYSTTGQVSVTVDAFFTEDVPAGRSERISSFFPRAALDIYELDPEGRIVAKRTIVKTHVLLSAGDPSDGG
ncbi:MAG: hypothetical protein ACF8R7_13715 [Phycisphaerales bacterium JB039]